MAIDSRDELWKAIWRAYYDAYFGELLSSKLISRWQIADDVSKVLVALTASSSAVAGWALWQRPEFKDIWTALASFSALLAIVHVALSVPRRVKDWGESWNAFLSLRIDLETLRERIRLDPDFDVRILTDELLTCRKRYSEAKAREPHDFLLSPALEKKTQDELNIRLDNDIQPREP
jgi:hypothetical protein